MGLQIIKQPDGRYAIWSTVVDDFLQMDLRESEVHEFFGCRAYDEAAESAQCVMEQLECGERPYFQFTLTWKQAQAARRR